MDFRQAAALQKVLVLPTPNGPPLHPHFAPPYPRRLTLRVSKALGLPAFCYALVCPSSMPSATFRLHFFSAEAWGDSEWGHLSSWHLPHIYPAGLHRVPICSASLQKKKINCHIFVGVALILEFDLKKNDDMLIFYQGIRHIFPLREK